MKRILLSTALVLLVLAARPAFAAPEGVAVINMVDVISSHPRIKEIETKFEQRQKSAQEYADRENKEMRDLQQEIELMQRNNPVRKGKEKVLAARQHSLQFEIEWRKQDALEEYVTGLESLYAEVQALVARYARENNISLVLQIPPEELKAADFNDYFAKVQLRTVVFSAGTPDITKEIKARLGQ
jgi:Skp family chaperone for outer membrane proteins